MWTAEMKIVALPGFTLSWWALATIEGCFALEDARCQYFENRPLNQCCAAIGIDGKHLRHGEIILVQAGSIRLVSEEFEFVFLGSSAQ
jgi:hypothetical protein